jgi:uncharacterized membrane protein
MTAPSKRNRDPDEFDGNARRVNPDALSAESLAANAHTKIFGITTINVRENVTESNKDTEFSSRFFRNAFYLFIPVTLIILITTIYTLFYIVTLHDAIENLQASNNKIVDRLPVMELRLKQLGDALSAKNQSANN